MMHTKRSRSIVGRPSRGLLYLAAAGALYAWRARRQGVSGSDRAARGRASRSERADADPASPSERGAGLEPGRNAGGAGPTAGEGMRARQIEPSDRWVEGQGRAQAEAGREAAAPAGRRHAGAGISDLPPDVEAEQQESLPPRGERKPGSRA